MIACTGWLPQGQSTSRLPLHSTWIGTGVIAEDKVCVFRGCIFLLFSVPFPSPFQPGAVELRKSVDFEQILGWLERRGKDQAPRDAGSVTTSVAARQGNACGIIGQVRLNAVDRRVERIESNVFTLSVIGGDGIPAWWIGMALSVVIRLRPF